MGNVKKVMLDLIKCVLRDEEYVGERESFKDVKFCEILFKFSKKHDMAHLIGFAIEKFNIEIPQTVVGYFKKEQMIAVLRYEQQFHELNRISDILEKEQIVHVPLKGSVIRNFYSVPWLRTSCDIDILVHEQDLERASMKILEICGGHSEGKGFHDESIFLDSNVHLELHFKLDGYHQAHNELYDETWENIVDLQNYEYRKGFTNEFLLAHYVSHMSSHFLSGGCGIKPFMDLWILTNKLELDDAKLTEILKGSNLAEFYNGVKRLAYVWFDVEKHDALTKEMQDFIFKGGVYGTVEQKVVVSHVRKGGKFKNFMIRVFMPYGTMATLYPSLKKFPPLYPIYIVRRWFGIFFSKRRKSAMRELGNIVGVTPEQEERMIYMVKELNL